MEKIIAAYFSPTGTTRTATVSLAGKLAKKTGGVVEERPFTTPKDRGEPLIFREEDRVVFGVPVYAGRVPNVLLNYIGSLHGNGAKTTALVVYGNRNYDDALVELVDLLRGRQFTVTAAAAFVGEHSFSLTLAAGRPDSNDLKKIEAFAEAILHMGEAPDPSSLQVKGNRPYRPYYKPQNPQGESVDLRKVQPLTSDACTRCGRCALLCPMGTIDKEHPDRLCGICIKCCACIKCCPVEAKYFDDENYLRHKVELEQQYANRKEPEWFLAKTQG